MNNILIIGCGLLGSSLIKRISKKKIAKKIFVYEKSKLNLAKIQRVGVNRFQWHLWHLIQRMNVL